MSIEVAEGKDVTISFDGKRCVHSRRCVMGEPGVFRANVAGPWIVPDATGVERVMRVAENCPSGAITVKRKDGGAEEAPPAANSVTLRENGPLALRGAITIDGHGEMLRATLCRCGLSRNKPFCDNSHIEGGFVASGEPPTRTSALTIADLTGPVSVKPQQNGPLLIAGKLEVSSGTGRNLNRISKAFFCRCGQSSNKPYCDWTHAKVGFEAP